MKASLAGCFIMTAMDKDHLLFMLGLGLLLIISVFASKTTSRYGVPILFIFIAIGMLSGSEGVLGVHFNDHRTTHIFGTVALVYILFAGGFSTDSRMIRPIWREGLTLAIVGVGLSTLLMGGIIHLVMGWSWVSSLLLSATFSSTDASAVFGILRTQKLDLKPRVSSLLEFESGSNDPMAVFLTVSLIQIILAPAEYSALSMLRDFFIQMSLGALAGWFMGKALVKIINWLKLEFQGLYPVLTMGGVICIYSLTEFCGGNGFLSVFLAGVSMSSEKFISKVSLNVFHDGLGWLMQVSMFLALGLLVNPSELGPVAQDGIMLAIGLIFVARPLSVILCLAPFRFRTFKELWFISWGGLRGAVPIILATYLLVSEVPKASTMFNIVFFIVITSMLVQGLSLAFMARKMDVQEAPKHTPRLPYKSRHLYSEFVEYQIPEDSELIGHSIFDLKLPHNVLVVLIHRGSKDFIPRGNTVIEAFDRVVVLAAKTVIPELNKTFIGLRPV